MAREMHFHPGIWFIDHDSRRHHHPVSTINKNILQLLQTALLTTLMAFVICFILWDSKHRRLFLSDCCCLVSYHLLSHHNSPCKPQQSLALLVICKGKRHHICKEFHTTTRWNTQVDDRLTPTGTTDVQSDPIMADNWTRVQPIISLTNCYFRTRLRAPFLLNSISHREEKTKTDRPSNKRTMNDLWVEATVLRNVHLPWTLGHDIVASDQLGIKIQRELSSL